MSETVICCNLLCGFLGRIASGRGSKMWTARLTLCRTRILCRSASATLISRAFKPIPPDTTVNSDAYHTFQQHWAVKSCGMAFRVSYALSTKGTRWAPSFSCDCEQNEIQI